MTLGQSRTTKRHRTRTIRNDMCPAPIGELLGSLACPGVFFVMVMCGHACGRLCGEVLPKHLMEANRRRT